MSTLTSSRVLAPIGTAGKLFAFGLDVFRGLFRRPFQVREFLQQAWFIASVTIIPTALVAIGPASRTTASTAAEPVNDWAPNCLIRPPT